jgi:hypothetical protein
VPQIGPSLSRKGGIRLHPVRDGVIPPVADRNRVLHRDRGGNVLTDVTNMQTGYCTGVKSPLTLEGGPVLKSTPVVPTHNPKRDLGLFPQLIGDVWVQGVGSNKHVVRTVDLGDKPIPSVPSRRRAASRQGAPVRRNDGPERAPRGNPIGSPDRLPNALIDAFIIGMHKQASKKKGKKVPPLKITKEMRRLARLEIQRRADIARYCEK